MYTNFLREHSFFCLLYIANWLLFCFCRGSIWIPMFQSLCFLLFHHRRLCYWSVFFLLIFCSNIVAWLALRSGYCRLIPCSCYRFGVLPWTYSLILQEDAPVLKWNPGVTCVEQLKVLCWFKQNYVTCEVQFSVLVSLLMVYITTCSVDRFTDIKGHVMYEAISRWVYLFISLLNFFPAICVCGILCYLKSVGWF